MDIQALAKIQKKATRIVKHQYKTDSYARQYDKAVKRPKVEKSGGKEKRTTTCAVLQGGPRAGGSPHRENINKKYIANKI